MIIREALVVDNIDENKVGKVKIRILPEMQNFEEDTLPWVAQYDNGTGLSSTSGKHNVYEIGSFIRVIVEDEPFYKRIRIISDDYVEGLYCYKNLDLSSISELSSQTYPQPIFQISKDGAISFHNTDTGETGFLYKNGSYYIVDANGNIFINTIDKAYKVYNDKGSVELTSDGTINISSDKDLVLSITGDSTVTSTGNVTVESSASTEIKGVSVKITGGTLQVDGSAAPTGTGAFCALPACLWSGAPHIGNIISGT